MLYQRLCLVQGGGGCCCCFPINSLAQNISGATRFAAFSAVWAPKTSVSFQNMASSDVRSRSRLCAPDFKPCSRQHHLAAY